MARKTAGIVERLCVVTKDYIPLAVLPAGLALI